MTYRATLAGLKTRVRELLNDTGGTPTWSDDQVAAALDQHREYHENEKLLGQYKILPGGTTVYREHLSKYANWESDYTLRDASGSTRSPDTGAGQTDPMVGYFYFGPGQNPPVYIDGK